MDLDRRIDQRDRSTGKDGLSRAVQLVNEFLASAYCGTKMSNLLKFFLFVCIGKEIWVPCLVVAKFIYRAEAIYQAVNALIV